MAFAIASQSVSRLLRRDLGKRPPMYKRPSRKWSRHWTFLIIIIPCIRGHQENDPTLLIIINIILTISVQSFKQTKFSFLKKSGYFLSGQPFQPSFQAHNLSLLANNRRREREQYFLSNMGFVCFDGRNNHTQREAAEKEIIAKWNFITLEDYSKVERTRKIMN